MTNLTPEQEAIARKAEAQIWRSEKEFGYHPNLIKSIISDAIARALEQVEERAEFHHNKAIDIEIQLDQELMNHAKTKTALRDAERRNAQVKL